MCSTGDKLVSLAVRDHRGSLPSDMCEDPERLTAAELEMWLECVLILPSPNA